MANTLMHMFRMNMLPFWRQDELYRSPVSFLKENESILDYINDNKSLLFIRDWGAIRAHTKARIFEHRIWRSLTNMSSRNKIDPANNIHLVPLRIIPTYKLVMTDNSLIIRNFFIYLTPHSISTHVIIEIKHHDYSRPLTQFENCLCIAMKKGVVQQSQTLFKLLEWVNEEVLKMILINSSSSYSEKLNCIWHSSFAIPDLQFDANIALNIFKKNSSVSRFAQKLIYDTQSDYNKPDWMIIDNRRSVMSLYPRKIISKKSGKIGRWANIVCHFNNWNDLLITYFSCYHSLLSARNFIDNGGKISPTTNIRLVSCFDVYQTFITSGWREEIELFEKSYTGESKMRRLYDDIKPRGGDIMIRQQEHSKNNNPWISGSFYLFSAILILAILAAICKVLSVWALPLLILGGLLLITVIGAFQMLNDSRLSEKNFLTLMKLSFQQIPFLGKFLSQKNKD